MLRQGKESPEWQEHEALTERICAITSTPAGGASDLVLREQVEQSLYHVGYGNIEASAIARRLSTPDGEDELMSRTELAARLKHHTRFGEQIEPRPLQETILPRNTVEETCYAQLRTLPFGTWLEFVMNQQGDVRRQLLVLVQSSDRPCLARQPAWTKEHRTHAGHACTAACKRSASYRH